MKIIFDNDATMTDYEKFINKYAVPYFRKKYGLEVVHPEALEIEDKYALVGRFSEDEVKKMLDSFWVSFRFVQYTLLSRFRPGAVVTVRRFLKQRYEVEIHTSRSKTCEKSLVGAFARALTIGQYWLNGLFLKPSKFRFYENDEKKLEGVLAANPTVIFDDKPWLVERYTEGGRKVLCVNGVHNSEMPAVPQVKRIGTLQKQEVQEALKTLLGESFIKAGDKGAKSDYLYSRLYWMQGILFGVFRPIVLNEQNILKTNKGIVYASNHRSTLDPIAITAVLRDAVHWVALKRFFVAEDSIFNNSKNPFLCKLTAYIFRKLGFFPIERKQDNPKANNMESIREIMAFLRIGHRVGIFPEGTTNRQKGQEFGDFDDSFLALARKTDAYVQPVTLLWIKEKNKKRIIVNFGKAFKVEGKGKEELMNEFCAIQESMLRENMSEAASRGGEIL